MHLRSLIAASPLLLACEHADEPTTCGPVVRADYSECADLVAFDDSCAAGLCVFGSTQTRVHAAWRARALELSGLGEAEFDARIHLRSVALRQPEFVGEGPWVAIDFVYAHDWVRAHAVDAIELPSEDPSDAEIAASLAENSDAAHWRGLGRIARPASERALQLAVDECACGAELRWCQIRFDGETLRIDGFKEVDTAANECLAIQADIGAGALDRCDETPCVFF